MTPFNLIALVHLRTGKLASRSPMDFSVRNAHCKILAAQRFQLPSVRNLKLTIGALVSWSGSSETPCMPKLGSLAQLAGVRKDQIHVIQKWAAGGRDNKEPTPAGMVVPAPE